MFLLVLLITLISQINSLNHDNCVISNSIIVSDFWRLENYPDEFIFEWCDTDGLILYDSTWREIEKFSFIQSEDNIKEQRYLSDTPSCKLLELGSDDTYALISVEFTDICTENTRTVLSVRAISQCRAIMTICLPVVSNLDEKGVSVADWELNLNDQLQSFKSDNVETSDILEIIGIETDLSISNESISERISDYLYTDVHMEQFFYSALAELLFGHQAVVQNNNSFETLPYEESSCVLVDGKCAQASSNNSDTGDMLVNHGEIDVGLENEVRLSDDELLQTTYFESLNELSELLNINKDFSRKNKVRSKFQRRKRSDIWNIPKNSNLKTPPISPITSFTEDDRLRMKDTVRNMFYKGYNNYLKYAYPEGELKPVSCTGGNFDLIKIPFVTLIDALDTLIVLGDFQEFRRAVGVLENDLLSFDFDVNISLFETTIRLLGGLLSAHLFAVDTNLKIYDESKEYIYSGHLLTLAIDLGDRLLPAFQTATGIPYGTVNLRHGVPPGETMISSLAAAGTLFMEFEVLSTITRDSRYGNAASAATKGLYFRRSQLGLYGKHINITSGQWYETSSGIGSNSDSFYEYLLKSFLLFGRKEYFRMFTDSFIPVKRYIQDGNWFVDVDMFSGKVRDTRTENLQAFWPGVESLMGFSSSAAELLNSLYDTWLDLGFLPEDLNIANWKPGRYNRMLFDEWEKGNGGINSFTPITDIRLRYLLRPELIESTYYQYRATGDRSWLVAGEWFVRSIEDNMQVECGYASISNGGQSPMVLEDTMQSFFLSETCKYLYLLFDESNFIHNAPYIFSTEAHPFDASQLRKLHRQNFSPREQITWFNVSAKAAKASSPLLHVPMQSHYDDFKMISANHELHGGNSKQYVAKTQRPVEVRRFGADLLHGPGNSPLLPMKCHAPSYLEALSSGFAPSLLLYITPHVMKSDGTTRDLRSVDRDFLADLGYVQSTVSVYVKSAFAREVLMKRIIRSDENRYMRLSQVTRLPGMKKIAAQNMKKCLSKEDEEATAAAAQKSKEMNNALLNAVNAARHQQQLLQVQEQIRNQLEQHDEQTSASASDNTVKFDIGELGTFDIKVENNEGVTIYSDTYKNRVEINNVGHSVAFAREINDLDNTNNDYPDSMGDSNGNTIRCSLSLLNKEDIAIDFIHHTNVLVKDADKAHEIIVHFLTLLGKVSGNRNCAVSALDYSIASGKIDVFPLNVRAELVIAPDDQLLCKSPLVDKDKKDNSISSWFNWGGGSNSNPSDNTPKPPIFADRIVLVKRGSCLFEEKAIIASAYGALGIVVMNTEDKLFVMAGRQEDSDTPASSLGQFPAVMIRKSDGEDLGKLVSFLHTFAFKPLFQLSVETTPLVVDNSYMGSVVYPKISVKESVVTIYTSKSWGAVLSNAGSEWQVFVLPADDLNAMNSNEILSEKGHHITANPLWTSNRVEQYAYHIARKCPGHVRYDAPSGVGALASVRISKPDKSSRYIV